MGGLAYRSAAWLWTVFNHAARRERSILAQMQNAQSFEEWQALAGDLDEIRQQMRPRRADASMYDEALLAAKVAELDALRARGRLEDLMFSLRSDLYRNFGNVTNRCGASPAHSPPATRRRETARTRACDTVDRRGGVIIT